MGNTIYQIRTAVPEDEKKIRELFVEMLRTIYHTDAAEGYEDGYLDKFWSGGEDRIYVAEDRVVIAFLSVEVYRAPAAHLYLDDFSVTAQSRNRGIGSALMRAGEAYAGELGIGAILLHVEKANGRAFRFYERLGYSVYRDDGSRYLMLKELA